MYEPQEPRADRVSDVRYWSDWLWGPDCGGGERLQRLLEYYEQGMLNVMVLREVLPHVWRHADAPLLSMTARRIVRVFRETGFVTDDVATVAPTESITVFRGCHPKVRLGVSWTTERAVAQSFSEGRGTLLLQKAQHARMVTRSHMVGSASVLPRLYTASAPPQAILAIFRERHEHEVIVDPRHLRNVRIV